MRRATYAALMLGLAGCADCNGDGNIDASTSDASTSDAPVAIDGATIDAPVTADAPVTSDALVFDAVPADAAGPDAIPCDQLTCPDPDCHEPNDAPPMASGLDIMPPAGATYADLTTSPPDPDFYAVVIPPNCSVLTITLCHDGSPGAAAFTFDDGGFVLPSMPTSGCPSGFPEGEVLTYNNAGANVNGIIQVMASAPACYFIDLDPACV